MDLLGTGARDDLPGETAPDCNDGGNDEGEEKGKEKSDSVVTEVPDCQEEKDTDKEEEYVILLNGIQMDVKRLWEGLLFYTACSKQLSEYYFSQAEINSLVHQPKGLVKKYCGGGGGGRQFLSSCIGKGGSFNFQLPMGVGHAIS